MEVVWSKPVDKQTYNTRKALTKVFTTGVSLSPDSSLGPRRRGAAGIRGLGAPGTAPPKQLVQRYAGMTSSGLPLPQLAPVPRQVSLRSSVEQLQDICLGQGWGEPLYSLLSGDAGEEASKAGQFCYKVTLPNFPLPAPHNTFQPSGWKLTAGETRERSRYQQSTLISLFLLSRGGQGGGGRVGVVSTEGFPRVPQHGRHESSLRPACSSHPSSLPSQPGTATR